MPLAPGWQELDESYLKPLFGGRQAGASFRGSYADLQVHGSEENSPHRLQQRWQQQQGQERQQRGRQQGGDSNGAQQLGGGGGRQHSLQREGQNVTEIQMEVPASFPVAGPEAGPGKGTSGGPSMI